MKPTNFLLLHLLFYSWTYCFKICEDNLNDSGEKWMDSNGHDCAYFKEF